MVQNFKNPENDTKLSEESYIAPCNVPINSYIGTHNCNERYGIA